MVPFSSRVRNEKDNERPTLNSDKFSDNVSGSKLGPKVDATAEEKANKRLQCLIRDLPLS